MYLSSDEYGLKSLVKILSLPQNVKGASYARDSMFDLFFEILDFAKTSDSSNAYSLNFGPNLLFNYIVTVLICFIENGLIKALVTIGMSNDKHSAFAAKSLLNEILKLSAGFLPVSICHELNMLTSVVINATKYSDTISTKQINASSMIVELSNGITAKSGESILQTSAFRMHRKHSEDSFIHVEILAAQTDTNSNFIRYRYNSQTRKNSLQIRYHIRPHHAHSICSRGKETSLKESLYHSLRSREHNMSEDQLQILLKKTNIINSKEFLTWDWDLCWNLLEGPFWNISLFRIVLKTKFVKRLLSFLTPSGRFCRLL